MKVHAVMIIILQKVVEAVIDSIALQLVNIFNTSLLRGLFPNELKVTKVNPVYKCDDGLTICNYCHKSVLPVFSKLFGPTVFNRISQFANKHNVLSENQFGFR